VRELRRRSALAAAAADQLGSELVVSYHSDDFAEAQDAQRALAAAAALCGADAGSPVWDKYRSPFKFTGKLHSVTVDVSGELIVDSEAELRVHMARQ
jgi:arylsulfatase